MLSYSRRSSVSVQAASQSFASDVVSAEFNRALSSDGKWVARLGGNFENDEYENVGTYRGRNDKSYRANFALTYNIRLWLSTSVSYEFEKHISNELSIIDYEVNRVSLRVSVGY